MCPWAAAYSCATVGPSAHADSHADHIIPSVSSSVTRAASKVPAA